MTSKQIGFAVAILALTSVASATAAHMSGIPWFQIQNFIGSIITYVAIGFFAIMMGLGILIVFSGMVAPGWCPFNLCNDQKN